MTSFISILQFLPLSSARLVVKNWQKCTKYERNRYIIRPELDIFESWVKLHEPLLSKNDLNSSLVLDLLDERILDAIDACFEVAPTNGGTQSDQLLLRQLFNMFDVDRNGEFDVADMILFTKQMACSALKSHVRHGHGDAGILDAAMEDALKMIKDMMSHKGSQILSNTQARDSWLKSHADGTRFLLTRFFKIYDVDDDASLEVDEIAAIHDSFFRIFRTVVVQSVTFFETVATSEEFGHVLLLQDEFWSNILGEIKNSISHQKTEDKCVYLPLIYLSIHALRHSHVHRFLRKVDFQAFVDGAASRQASQSKSLLREVGECWNC